MKSLLLSLVLAASLSGQAVAPGKQIAVAPDAMAVMDAMAKRTIATHREQIACVTGYALRDSTLLVIIIGPARNVTTTDSLHVYANGETCAWWQPSIHTHLIDNGLLDIPSPVDQHTAAVRGVFSFLVSVRPDSTWKLRVYP